MTKQKNDLFTFKAKGALLAIRTGPRHVKWLQAIEVRKITE